MVPWDKCIHFLFIFFQKQKGNELITPHQAQDVQSRKKKYNLSLTHIYKLHTTKHTSNDYNK